MFDVSWLLGQINNFMARIATWFVIMSTHVHLGIAYDVAEGSFPFNRTKKPFSIFRCQKGFFCEATTKLKFHIATKHFFQKY
jgi:hypothetical protein